MTNKVSDTDITAISNILDNQNLQTDYIFVVSGAFGDNFTESVDITSLLPSALPANINIIIAYLGQTNTFSGNVNLSFKYNSSVSIGRTSLQNKLMQVPIDVKTKIKQILSSPNDATDIISIVSDVTIGGNLNMQIDANQLAIQKKNLARNLNYILIYRGASNKVAGTVNISFTLKDLIAENLRCPICTTCQICEKCEKCEKCETFTTPAIILIAILLFLLLIFIVLYIIKKPKKIIDHDD